MFADDLVGISETPEGLQKQVEKVQEYTGEWGMTANVNKCRVLVYIEDEKNPVEVKRNRDEGELA